MRSASRKLRNMEATIRSCRKSRLKSSGWSCNTHHAMVSVTAVKIQFNSPKGVRRSAALPGNRDTISMVIFVVKSGLRMTTHRSDISIGVVRHAVNTSAGKSGFIGSVSVGPHAAS